MWVKLRVRRHPRAQRCRALRPQALEGLEDRRLLSAVVGSVSAGAPAAVGAGGGSSSSQAAMVAAGEAILQQRRTMFAFRHAHIQRNHGSELAQVGNDASNTVKVGWGQLTSSRTRQAASRYLSLAFSPKTWDVGLDYAKAFFSGDFTKFSKLSSSQSTQQVGSAFKKLNASNLVQTVGNGFGNFGKAVDKTFKKA